MLGRSLKEDNCSLLWKRHPHVALTYCIWMERHVVHILMQNIDRRIQGLSHLRSRTQICLHNFFSIQHNFFSIKITNAPNRSLHISECSAWMSAWHVTLDLPVSTDQLLIGWCEDGARRGGGGEGRDQGGAGPGRGGEMSRQLLHGALHLCTYSEYLTFSLIQNISHYSNVGAVNH